MGRYVVAGPERDYQEWVPGCYGGPRDTGRDVFLVDAPSRKAARWAAFKEAKERQMAWWYDLGNEHPLSDTRVTHEPWEQPDDWGEHYINLLAEPPVRGAT